jgi:hypothetical protein
VLRSEISLRRVPTATFFDQVSSFIGRPIGTHAQAILQDYPGGQLQEEALQNAEDSGATEFALMLDLRRHEGVDSRLAGPAFVLVDNGGGLGDREWTSLQNLHRSEKREYAR